MLAPLFALGRFLAPLGRFFRSSADLAAFVVGFFAFWNAPGSILEGPGGFRGVFSRLPGPIFQSFFEHRGDIARTPAILEKP